MCAYVRERVCVYMYECVRVYVHVRVCVCTCVYVCTRIYVSVRLRVRVRVVYLSSGDVISYRALYRFIIKYQTNEVILISKLF